MTYIPLLRVEIVTLALYAFEKSSAHWLENRLNTLNCDELREVLSLKTSQMERGELVAEGMMLFYYKPYAPMSCEEWSIERVEHYKNSMTDKQLAFLREYLVWSARVPISRPRFFSRDVRG
jgi:hypothetical protein